jgi:F0F1-type ATP synthase membrane subunit c/vacuolar-type H+-ATPase subunit K
MSNQLSEVAKLTDTKLAVNYLVKSGIGAVLTPLVSAVARNPSMGKQLFIYTILGFVLTEAFAPF